MDYVAMFPETFEAVKRYSPADRCFIYEAMGEYAFTGQGPTWAEDDLKWFVWEALRQRIDAAQRIRDARKAAGSMGGRPKRTEPMESNENQTKANESKQKQSEGGESKKTPESETESDTESDSKEKRGRKESRFAPPTVEEVAAYIREKGYNVDAERFVSYYESIGWRVGKNPMKNWRQAVCTWSRTQYDRPKKTVVAQQYEQRDYSQQEPEQMPEWMMERWKRMQKEGTA